MIFTRDVIFDEKTVFDEKIFDRSLNVEIKQIINRIQFFQIEIDNATIFKKKINYEISK